jgi:hypothetical protein
MGEPMTISLMTFVAVLAIVLLVLGDDWDVRL